MPTSASFHLISSMILHQLTNKKANQASDVNSGAAENHVIGKSLITD